MMTHFKEIKHFKLKISLLSFVAMIALILYLLADRYLIEHVIALEVVPMTTSEVKMVTAISSGNETLSETKAPLITSSDREWTYVSDDIQIEIQQIQEGAGSNIVTYYIADVVVSDVSYLKSAFAKNLFGENIVEATSTIAESNNAIFAVNGDYYGFRDDGILIRNGVLYRDDPARTALAIYEDGTMSSVDEDTTSGEELLDSSVIHTLSFGPSLISDGSVTSDFSSVAIDKNVGNKSIQDLNPRTGIGWISPKHFVFIVVDGRSSGYSVGMTLSEFAEVFQELGCTEAYNLDGGGSSTMVFMGDVINNPLGKNKERSISDILYLSESN